MELINIHNLLEQAPKAKKHFITAEARDLANKLIFEYGIAANHDLADFLEVSPTLNGQRAVRVWTQKQLPLLDSDETHYERYRQLRRLFYQAIEELI